MEFFHGTDAPSATALSAGAPVLAIGRGEFGAGFYTFIRRGPAELAAADYTRRRGLPMWGVVDFRVPVELLLQYGLFEAIRDLLSVSHVLIFPDRTTRVPVRYPDDQGGMETSLNWSEFVAENRRMGRSVSWPYDLIIGPLSGTLAGFRNENQFLFNNDGVILLNDPRVRRSLVASGPT